MKLFKRQEPTEREFSVLMPADLAHVDEVWAHEARMCGHEPAGKPRVQRDPSGLRVTGPVR